nr:alpha/beta hydrolase [Actinomycetota bacterium]
MEQDIRFCELDGRRIAYATVGEGPLLLFGGRWVSHLEEEWDEPRARSFYEELGRTYRVVRYDRIGAGLSDRELPGGPATAEAETRQLKAVLDACGGEQATMFACSCAGLATAQFASAWPDRVSKVIFFGGYAARDDIPEATRRSLVDFVRVNWQLASQMLSGLFLPHAGGEEIIAMSRYQRHSADADVAAAFLELDLTSDARQFLPSVTMPALVLHRRGDRTVPISRGRELASLLPNARF